MGRYDSLLYKRGFLFTDLQNPKFEDPVSQKAFERFRRIPFFSWGLYCDDCVPTGSAQDGTNAVSIIGLVLNPFDGLDDSDKIAEKLLSCRTASEISFLDYLGKLSGRFVVILKFGEAPEVFADACATRTVFYDYVDSHVIFSSHATLIAELMNYEISDDANYFFYNPLYKSAPIKRLPGLTSPYAEIRPLTPNTKVNAIDKTITRIFPLKSNPVCTNYAELEEEVADLMVKQIEMLHKKEKIMMSLSAGLDTRFSLAASRNISHEIEYFTHITKNKAHIEDTNTAVDICKHFGLKHKVYQWNNAKYSDGMYDFEQIWVKNMGIRRGILWLNKLYADSFPQGKIHLRSNIAEVAKAELSDHERHELSPSTLAYLYTTTPMMYDERVIKKFAEFITLTGFTEENMYNFDFYDMFTWEFVMCLWHSWLLLESDMSHDTFILFNNREILSKMLSLPYEDRLSKKLFFGVIRRLWPELMEFPINKVLYK